MTLIICSTCKKIIGCGINEDGTMKKCCYHCYHTACEAEIRIPAVKKGVVLVHFEDGCSGHSPPPIGFRLEKK